MDQNGLEETIKVADSFNTSVPEADMGTEWDPISRNWTGVAGGN